jgi:small-conductance mechanosensitive channel
MHVSTRFGVFLGLLCLPLWSVFAEQAAPAEPVAEAAELKVANRSVVVLRNTLLGETPAARVRRAELVIQEALEGTEEVQVSLEAVQTSYLVLLGGQRAFIVSPKDLEPGDDSVRRAAERAAENLRLVVSETHEARNLRFLLVAGGLSGAATLLYVLLIRFVFFIRRKLLGVLPRLMYRHSSRLKVGDAQLLDTLNIYPFLARMLGLLGWLIVLLLTYEWLSFVLRRFPYTRPWGESLNGYLVDLATYILDAVVGAIPGLVIALCIFLIARGVSAFSKRLVERLAVSGSIGWLSRETLQPTTRLTSLAIWLFAFAMAYPYLPGADTEAFKGLSVLIGLMISLGASSVVGQAAAGLILTYTRTLRVGEFVRIGEHEGTVTELGMFTTSIRTGQGEMLTIPNTMITGAVTRNYSRAVQGGGLCGRYHRHYRL